MPSTLLKEQGGCLLRGTNTITLNIATMNEIVGYVLKRFSHIPDDAIVEFSRKNGVDSTFDFIIKREKHNED